MGNPYKARKKVSAPVVTEEEVVVVPTPPVVAEKEPEAVPEGKVDEILEWVGEDVDRAVQALSAEEAGARRKTLTKVLEEIIAAS